VFAVVLVLFITLPSLPGSIHHALWSDPDTRLPDPAGSLSASTDGIPQSQGEDPLLAYDIDQRQQTLGRRLDQEVVRLLAESKLKRKSASITPVAPNELYSISRFRMDNGKDVLVYTRLPLKQAGFRESY